MDRAFTGTPSRISGITFDTIIGDLVKYHDMAFPKDPEQTGYLPKYGIESRFTAARIGEREESARAREREREAESRSSRASQRRALVRERSARARERERWRELMKSRFAAARMGKEQSESRYGKVGKRLLTIMQQTLLCRRQL